MAAATVSLIADCGRRPASQALNAVQESAGDRTVQPFPTSEGAPGLLSQEHQNGQHKGTCDEPYGNKQKR